MTRRTIQTARQRMVNADMLRAISQAEFSRKNADERVGVLRPLGVRLRRINTADAVLNHPRVWHRQTVVEVDHAAASRSTGVGMPNLQNQ